MKRSLPFMSALAVVGVLAGCGEDASRQLGAGAPPVDLRDARTLDRLARSADVGVGELSAGARVVVLPSGSTDALAGAIASAGSGGAVILRAGAHTESHGVTITQPVSLLGESGAVLRVDTHADFFDVALDPAIHIRNTTNVVVWGLEIRPVGPIGGAAIVVERSPRLILGHNKIFDHQNSILLHFSDQRIVWGNRIVVTGAWLTGDALEADGITAVNGAGVSLLGNDISNGFFGIFASGRAGVLSGNVLHENFFGLILCRVPAGAFRLPGGEFAGSMESCNHWNLHDNSATNNLDAGYLVIDGANNNTMSRNAGSGNAVYDIDLVGESTRFGFCTPTCFDNTVRATGRYANLVIKNCGQNNTVIGGHQVDTALDPCDAPCPAQAVAGGGPLPKKCAPAFLNNRSK